MIVIFSSEHRINHGQRGNPESYRKGHQGSMVTITGQRWKWKPLLLLWSTCVAWLQLPQNLQRIHQKENYSPEQFFFLLKNLKAWPRAVETQSRQELARWTSLFFLSRGKARGVLETHEEGTGCKAKAERLPELLSHQNNEVNKRSFVEALQAKAATANGSKNKETLWWSVGVCTFRQVTVR